MGLGWSGLHSVVAFSSRRDDRDPQESGIQKRTRELRGEQGKLVRVTLGLGAKPAASLELQGSLLVRTGL